MTHEMMVRQYMNTTGKKVTTEAEQQAFNDWAGAEARKAGVSTSEFEKMPADYYGGANNPFQAPPNEELDSAVNTALLAGANGAAAGGNTQQVQQGTQSGAFNTTGNTSTTGSQNQSQTQATQGSSNTNTSQVGTQQGTTSQTGTTNTTGQTQQQTGVVDTLGFGDLLKNQGQQAGANDAARNTYLTDLIATGGDGFNNQIDQAVRSSQSGPGMQGVGDSGKGRAAAYAVEQVANNNQNQRLNAAQQLAGPSATTTLANAGAPYLGQTSNQTSNQVGNTSEMGTQEATNTSLGNTKQNTSSLGSMLSSALSSSNEQSSQGGSSAAKNTQIAAGNTPEQSTSSGGGSIVCTALVEHELLDKELVEAELRFIKRNWDTFKQAAKGYYSFGVPLAKLVRRSRLVALCVAPIARSCSREAAKFEGVDVRSRWWDSIVYGAFFGLSHALGGFIKGDAVVRDPEVLDMLAANNLLLPL